MPSWVGDVLAGAFIVAAAFTPFPGQEFRPGSIVAAAIVVIPALLLPLRRRWPIPILGLVIALYGVAAFTGTLSPGIIIAAAIAMFGVANRLRRGTTVIVAGCAVVAIALLSLLAVTGNLLDPRAIQFVVTVAFAAAAGDAAKSRREYLQAVTERAERAEQTRESEARRRVTEERLKIARDLHDTVAHQISVISLNAGVATSALERRPEKALEALGTIRSAARTVLGEIGDLLEILRSDDDFADPATLPQPGLDRLNELVQRFGAGGLTVNLRIDGDLSMISGSTELVAYRVIQEALTNAHKHGAEHRAHVLISVENDRARLVITNPMPSSDRRSPTKDDVRSGHGLLGLRERVASVRGTVTTGTTPGGYRVAVELPIAGNGSR